MQRLITAVLLLLLAVSAWCAEPTITGTVSDSLGAVIPGATVTLLQGGKDIAQTTSDATGNFHFKIDRTGRYSVRAEAKTFAPGQSDEVFAEPGHSVDLSLTLSPSVVSQNIVVTATGIATPEAQMGTSVSVIDDTTLSTRVNLDQTLRNEVGGQVVQTGQMGSLSALFVRGGPPDANKVLIDGVPVNDIGGTVDFSYLQADGFDRVEFQRGPNSALYGSDALASVVSVSTQRGNTPLPLFSLGADGGTFGTYHQDDSVSGYWKRLDYFTGFSGYGTQNNVPDSQYHRNVYLGNLGYQITPNTTLRATVRRLSSGFNSANAVYAYGIPDDASTLEGDTSFGATLENRTGDRWHSLVQYGGLRMRQQYNDWAPTGIPYDPYGLGFPSYYLGLPVTQRGANGYVITPWTIAQVDPTLAQPGQAIYQYAGNYPELSSYYTNTSFVYAQTDYRFNEKLTALFGFRYTNENGFTYNGFTGKESTDRNNFSYMMEIQGGLWNRLFYTLGGGIENNAVFGVAGTPRASLAYYLKRPGNSRIFSGTRLTFNFAKGIKEPSIYYQNNSLFGLLSNTSIVPNGPELIQRYHIQPFLAEDSRTYDGGVEQQLFGGNARLSAVYFHNEFTNQAEYVSSSYLVQLGVPEEVAQALGFFGAAVNTLNYRAQGAEVGFQYRINRKVSVRGGWTYTDAVVQQSFSSSALQPAINPLFPNVPIGAYSPLVGARPFRIAPNTGFAGVDWNYRRWFISAMGTFVSRRDDSTFLSDTNFGNTLLLPNRNLDSAYQKLDIYGSYQVAKHITAYTSLQNVLNQKYQEVYGFPALPFTIRGGMKFTLGGESWKLN
ncbi:MAG TPA: TonB-dependent receptor [Terriglobales bacterium]|nr:TonB-dependent receptor [Terriglobales bacterium]